MTATFTKKRKIPARLLRIQNAIRIPTTPTAVMATAWENVIGDLPLFLLSTSLLTTPMLRSRHGR
jgi:hypothetical protein